MSFRSLIHVCMCCCSLAFATQSLAYTSSSRSTPIGSRLHYYYYYERRAVVHARSKTTTNQGFLPWRPTSGYPRPLEMSSSLPGQQHAAAALTNLSKKFSSRFFRSTTKTCLSSATATAATTALRGGAVVLAAASSTNAAAIGNWIFPALACAASYALYNIFIKKASATIDPILGGVLLQFVAALVGTMLLIFQRARATHSTTNTLLLSKSGLSWAVAAGVAVGAAEILSFIISSKGVPATQSIPIVVGGSILMGTLLGSVWLQERLTRSGWFGVLLIAVGIALVGMDPGSTAGH